MNTLTYIDNTGTVRSKNYRRVNAARKWVNAGLNDGSVLAVIRITDEHGDSV